MSDIYSHTSLRTHAEEFEHFRRCLRLPAERTHLLTWQMLLAQAEATLDPAVRPLLAHASRLSGLQPSDQGLLGMRRSGIASRIRSS